MVANPLQLLEYDVPLHHDAQVLKHNTIQLTSLQLLWQLVEEHALLDCLFSRSVHDETHPDG